MAILWGDTGKVAIGPLKTFNIALAVPRESLAANPTALPSAEPTTPQVSVTIEAGDLPTISPNPLGLKYTAALYAAGKNADAAAQTVSWRILKNGVSVATGTSASVPANQFWTHGYFQFFDVVPGDVLAVKLWSASANVNYDYWGLTVYPTRVSLGSAEINKNVTYGATTVATMSTGTVNLNINAILYPSDLDTSGIGYSPNIVFGALRWNVTYNAFRVDLGDSNQTTQTLNHATARPHYRRNIVPSTISFREVLR